MKLFAMLVFIIASNIPSNAAGHIPVLLLPLQDSPVSSYFIGQSSVSRAIYSELTNIDDFFVMTMIAEPDQKTLIQLLTPVCESLPRYEKYQPTALIIRGDLPWKFQGESNKIYLSRLSSLSLVAVSSNFELGSRPKFYEEFGETYYWIGGEWGGSLDQGLYSVVVFDSNGDKGNFNISINEKEEWTPDLYKYVEKILPVIKKGFCNPNGFTGELSF
jgi:hypothetical protein